MTRYRITFRTRIDKKAALIGFSHKTKDSLHAGKDLQDVTTHINWRTRCIDIDFTTVNGTTPEKIAKRICEANSGGTYALLEYTINEIKDPTTQEYLDKISDLEEDKRELGTKVSELEETLKAKEKSDLEFKSQLQNSKEESESKALQILELEEKLSGSLAATKSSESMDEHILNHLMFYAEIMREHDKMVEDFNGETFDVETARKKIALLSELDINTLDKENLATEIENYAKDTVKIATLFQEKNPEYFAKYKEALTNKEEINKLIANMSVSGAIAETITKSYNDAQGVAQDIITKFENAQNAFITKFTSDLLDSVKYAEFIRNVSQIEKNGFTKIPFYIDIKKDQDRIKVYFPAKSTTKLVQEMLQNQVSDLGIDEKTKLVYCILPKLKSRNDTAKSISTFKTLLQRVFDNSAYSKYGFTIEFSYSQRVIEEFSRMFYTTARDYTKIIARTICQTAADGEVNITTIKLKKQLFLSMPKEEFNKYEYHKVLRELTQTGALVYSGRSRSARITATASQLTKLEEIAGKLSDDIKPQDL